MFNMKIKLKKHLLTVFGYCKGSLFLLLNDQIDVLLLQLACDLETILFTIFKYPTLMFIPFW